jgi:hypothetical protein
MELQLTFNENFCAADHFRINGKRARTEEFGEGCDNEPEAALEYGCGSYQFKCHPATPAVLAKYALTAEEYAELCDELESGLSFGCCQLCA